MKWKEKLRKRWDQIRLYYLYLPSILLAISIFCPHRTVKAIFMILAIVTALLDLLRYLHKERKEKQFSKKQTENGKT